MMQFFDARPADEGRSFLSKRGGGNKLGEQVFDARVSIHSDPWDPEVPGPALGRRRPPREKMALVDKGKVANLDLLALLGPEGKGKRAMGRPAISSWPAARSRRTNWCAARSSGILVTRTWYIRMVDPQTVLLTGLTRDGTFYIEDGEISTR